MASPLRIVSRDSTRDMPDERGRTWETIKAPTVEIRDASSTELPANARNIEIDELYSEQAAITPALSASLRILGNGIGFTERALESIRDDDPIRSDDAIQQLRGLLPEMFCLRSLGDGFGLIINACNFSLVNLRGAPATEAQIIALRQCLVEARSHPSLNASQALEKICRLEEVGLDTDPAELEYVADLLGD